MLSAKPKTEADNTYQGLKDKHTVTRLIVIGNHTLRAQPTD